MRFYTKSHAYYCGIDLHARWMYICVIDQAGKTVYHRNHRTQPEALLTALTPYREDVVVAVECMFSWYWVADLCEEVGLPFVLGHALYMKAIHGGKAKNDRIDSRKIAALLRGGMFPLAYVYPRSMRASRDLLRRRLRLVRLRAEMNVHVQNTRTQYNLAPTGTRLRWPGNRKGVADDFQDPSARKNVELDLELMNTYDLHIHDLEKHLLKTAAGHDGKALALLRTVPGIGKVLALTILYEIGHIRRFPSVQDFASYARLVKPAKESAGKKQFAKGGAKIGNAHLRWAFSEAAALMIAKSAEGKRVHDRLKKKHPPGKAITILAHKLGRAVYFMLRRETAFDIARFAGS